MGLNSMQQFANNLVSDLPTPQYKQNLVSYIMPPNPGELTGPAAYVWITNGDNNRQTAPRGHGFFKMKWIANVWLMAVGTTTDQNANSKFALLCDSVRIAFTTVTMPVMVTDDVLNETTQLLSIGEVFSFEQSPVHSLSDQRLILCEALFRFTIEEAYVK
jgi:hypothetical protein